MRESKHSSDYIKMRDGFRVSDFRGRLERQRQKETQRMGHGGRHSRKGASVKREEALGVCMGGGEWEVNPAAGSYMPVPRLSLQDLFAQTRLSYL